MLKLERVQRDQCQPDKCLNHAHHLANNESEINSPIHQELDQLIGESKPSESCNNQKVTQDEISGKQDSFEDFEDFFDQKPKAV